MAHSESDIPLLRARLAASRARLQEETHEAAESLDIPSRVRREVAAHPFKWAAAALLGGAVAARVVAPLAMKLVGRSSSQKLTRTLLTTLAPVAVRLGAQALSTKFPGLISAVSPPPPSPTDAADDAPYR